MRRQSRWAVAALAAACVAAVVFPAAARSPHRVHRANHAVHASPPPVPAPGMPSTYEARGPIGGAADGKGNPPSTLGTRDAEAVLGKSVHSATGEDMGRLVDVIVDTNGRPRAAIIDFGGFLGVGSRKIAVDWSLLKFVLDDPKGNVVTVALTRDQVKSAPEFKEGSPVTALGASSVAPPAKTPPPQAQEK